MFAIILLSTIVLKKTKSVFINLEKINDIFVVLKLSRDPVDKP